MRRGTKANIAVVVIAALVALSLGFGIAAFAIRNEEAAAQIWKCGYYDNRIFIDLGRNIRYRCFLIISIVSSASTVVSSIFGVPHIARMIHIRLGGMPWN